MAPPSRSALIFGTGSNIGPALVKGYLDAGYRVATVSRSKDASGGPAAHPDVHHIQADLADPESVARVYADMASAGYPFPSVVVWNAAAVSPPTDPANPFEVPEDAFRRDLDLMVTNPYIASREAVRVWQEIDKNNNNNNNANNEGKRKGTFIMTGNLLVKKTLPVPSLVGLGIGKCGAFSWLSLADAVLREKGIRFFFADERKEDGSPIGTEPTAEGHAKVYVQLTEDDSLPTYVTFVDGKYREFP